MVQKMCLNRKVADLCGVLFVSMLLCHSVVAMTDPAEKEALGSVSNSLIDDGNLASWDPDTDPCESWLGVYCVPEDYPPNVDSNYSHVTELRLLSLNLSGTLAPELGNLPALKYLDFMWNKLTGSIPSSIGNLSNLDMLLLNGNELAGVLPPELGNLQNMSRIQIDQNNISGPVPNTFGNLTSVMHLHMNNNSLSGSIPGELGKLPQVVHILLDNNNLTGTLPPELYTAPKLLIIQLDNNQFDSGSEIPQEYAQIPTLLKLSLRNCNLVGPIPDFTNSTNLSVIDLSFNNLNGTLPTASLPVNLTSVAFSHNNLTGDVPGNIGSLPQLQFLELSDNQLSGNISANLGSGPSFTGNNSQIVLDFQNNSLVLPSESPLAALQSQLRVQVWLYGNPSVCPVNGPSNPFCIPTQVQSYLDVGTPQPPTAASPNCAPCNSPYSLVPSNSQGCRCAAPITVYYRLKSPGFVMFDLYEEEFIVYLSQGLDLQEDQVYVQDYTLEPGPRIAITVLLFPTPYPNFNQSELNRLYSKFANWAIPDSTIFGPYELLQYVPPGIEASGGGSSKLSGGAIAGIVVGVLLALILAPALLFFVLRRRGWSPRAAAVSRRISVALRKPINVAGVRTFTFEEMQKATDNFSEKNLLGQGGYGKVYYGTLENNQKVAVKRAEEGSLQGANEFETEIQLLSRVHHRNLVSLIGYCNDEGEHSQGEQMLVYEYMPNGTLRDHLNKTTKFPLDFVTRLRIALGSARGIHYLHTQADPPIFHRDIKATNILLDEKYNAKVADFGLSKLAPTDVDFEGANAGHVSTVVKGTPGYLDPEYFLTHKLTDKSDVYSFGVVLLELITGMHPISQGKNIVREVNIAFIGGGMGDIVDKRMGTYPNETMEPFTRLALACCKGETDSRPGMSEVLHELEEIWKETPWSDVASHSYVGDAFSRDFSMVDPRGFSTDMPRGFSTEMNLYDRSDVGNSDLISGTNINIQPR